MAYPEIPHWLGRIFVVGDEKNCRNIFYITPLPCVLQVLDEKCTKYNFICIYAKTWKAFNVTVCDRMWFTFLGLNAGWSNENSWDGCSVVPFVSHSEIFYQNISSFIWQRSGNIMQSPSSFNWFLSCCLEKLSTIVFSQWVFPLSNQMFPEA